MGRSPAIACLALFGAMAAATAVAQPVGAPCRLCTSAEPEKSDRPAAPVRLEVEASLNFDRLILGGPGTGSAELSPGGARLAQGSVQAIGARAMAGLVVVRGEPGRQVRIDLPRSIELRSHNGGSLQLESIESDLPPVAILDSSGRLRFRFGGVLRISGEADGDYRGDIRVNVEYL